MPKATLGTLLLPSLLLVSSIFQNLASLGFFSFPLLGMSSPDFDNQTLAVLRGRMVRYLMRSREVSSVFHSAVPKTKEVNSLLPALIMKRKLNHFSTMQIKRHNQAAFDFEVYGVFVCSERSKTLGYSNENILIEEQV